MSCTRWSSPYNACHPLLAAWVALIDIHISRTTLLSFLLHSFLHSFEECFYRITTTKRDAAVMHETPVLDLDLQCLADTRQTAIP